MYDTVKKNTTFIPTPSNAEPIPSLDKYVYNERYYYSKKYEKEYLETLWQSQNDSNPMCLEQSPVITNTANNGSSFNNSSFLQRKTIMSVGNLRAVDEIHKPVVISAPTGSGKTVVFEFALIRLLMRTEELEYYGGFTVVYLAPVKALCSERFCDWQSKFTLLGLTCKEVTGDSDTSDLSELSQCNIILTTPEKWDSLTRNWRDKTKLVQDVKLFLIDEVHLLSEEKRGPVMEAVVSRMKTIQETLSFHSCQQSDISIPLRFIAVSATIPNIEDVACWLGTVERPALAFALSEDYRPVKLNRIVLGYDCPPSFSQFRFEIQLSYKLRPLLFKYSQDKPSLIFCSTRKGVLQTSDVLSKQITFHFSTEQKQRLFQCTSNMKENKLKDYILAGIGCHHAGMDMSDRRIVEELFRSGFLPVLVTTSTLAMGVNLPAHLVIIKSTQQYAGGCYQDYSENQLLQMMGRAGRPQFDTSATAIIMTRNNKVNRYQRLVESKDLLESSLHRHLAEHLNSEVVLSTITEKAVAINWIRSTFLYVRALRNPKYYGISAELSKKGIEDKLQEMCLRELNALASINLVKMDILDVEPTETGRLMAQFYMAFETMKTFTKITGNEKLHEMLAVVASCHEFADFQLRINEKRTLNALNQFKNGIRFPLLNPIKTREMKINCLVQASFGALTIPDPSLHQESIRIIHIGQRVAKCLAKYLSLQPHYRSLLSAVTLAKCFHCCLWENSLYVSRQLERIGPVLSACLVASGKTSFQAIAESNPRDLERIMNRPSPMGDRVKLAVTHLPQYCLQVEMLKSQVEIRLELVNVEKIENSNTAGPSHWLHLLAGDSNNKLLLYKRFRDALLIENGGSYNWMLALPSSTEEVSVNLVSEQWVGLDVSSSTKLTQGTTPIPPTVQASVQKYIANSQKSIANKTKNKSTSVLSQLRDISSGFLQDVGTKRLRNNCLDVTPGRGSLDQFLYTPTRSKKLTPATSNSTIILEGSNPDSVYSSTRNAELEIQPTQLVSNKLQKQPMSELLGQKEGNQDMRLRSSLDGLSGQTILDQFLLRNKKVPSGLPNRMILDSVYSSTTTNSEIELTQSVKQTNNKSQEQAMRNKMLVQMEENNTPETPLYKDFVKLESRSINLNNNSVTMKSKQPPYNKQLGNTTVQKSIDLIFPQQKNRFYNSSEVQAQTQNGVHLNSSRTTIDQQPKDYMNVIPSQQKNQIQNCLEVESQAQSISNGGHLNSGRTTVDQQTKEYMNVIPLQQNNQIQNSLEVQIQTQNRVNLNFKRIKLESRYYPIFLGALEQGKAKNLPKKKDFIELATITTQKSQLSERETATDANTQESTDCLQHEWRAEDLQVPSEINFDMEIETLLCSDICADDTVDTQLQSLTGSTTKRKYLDREVNQNWCDSVPDHITMLPHSNPKVTRSHMNVSKGSSIAISPQNHKVTPFCSNQNITKSYMKVNKGNIAIRPLDCKVTPFCSNQNVAKSYMKENKENIEPNLEVMPFCSSQTVNRSRTNIRKPYVSDRTVISSINSQNVNRCDTNMNSYCVTASNKLTNDTGGDNLSQDIYSDIQSQESSENSPSTIWCNESQDIVEDLPRSWVLNPTKFLASSGVGNTMKNERFCISPVVSVVSSPSSSPQQLYSSSPFSKAESNE